MVEIFKTKVQSHEEGRLLLQLVQRKFPNYNMNLDLEDCDKILRVENKSGKVVVENILDLAELLSLPIMRWTEEEIEVVQSSSL